MIDKLDQTVSIMKEQRIRWQAEKNWKETLDKLWPKEEDDGI